MNKKYYITMAIILIIYLIIIITGGILIGPVKKENIPSVGGFDPAVMPNQTQTLIINILIIIIANIVSIFSVIKDRKNVIKKIGLLLILLLSIFLIPVQAELDYMGKKVYDYITIWEMI